MGAPRLRKIMTSQPSLARNEATWQYYHLLHIDIFPYKTVCPIDKLQTKKFVCVACMYVGQGFSLAFGMCDWAQSRTYSRKTQRYCGACGKPKGSPYDRGNANLKVRSTETTKPKYMGYGKHKTESGFRRNPGCYNFHRPQCPSLARRLPLPQTPPPGSLQRPAPRVRMAPLPPALKIQSICGG